MSATTTQQYHQSTQDAGYRTRGGSNYYNDRRGGYNRSYTERRGGYRSSNYRGGYGHSDYHQDEHQYDTKRNEVATNGTYYNNRGGNYNNRDNNTRYNNRDDYYGR